MTIRDIFKENDFIFIAEIGINHNGDCETACNMIEAASRARATAVKFQTFVAEKMFSSYGKSLIENSITPYRDYSQIEFFRKLTLRKEEYVRIAHYAKKLGIVFFSSVFDDESLALLESLEVPLYKIASSEVTNEPLLELIGKTGKPVILSTGICTRDEIGRAISILRENGTPDIALLHCVSLYPLPPERANLKRIIALRDFFNLEVGFSDHSPDFSAVILAASHGARIFEKHFTLSRNFECPDAPVSLDPAQFSEMIQACRRVKIMLGDGSIDYDEHQKDVAKSARRSLYATTFIPRGKKVAAEDIAAKRPGVGLSPSLRESIIGKTALVDIEEDSLLRMEYFA